MTQRKLTTIIGATITLVAVFLPGFGLELTESEAGELTTALATVIGIVLTVLGPSIKPPKGGATAVLALVVGFLTFGAVLTPMTGCQTVKDNPEVSKAVFRIALRAATHAVVQKNPDLQPYLAGMGAVFAVPEDALEPDRVKGLVDTSINDLEGLTASDRALLASITDEALALYSDIYAANLDRLTQNDYRDILEAIGQAIAAGAVPAVAGSVASPSFVMDTPAGLVQIE